MKYLDHIQGTDMNEWQCEHCQQKWASTEKPICNCDAGLHEARLEMHQLREDAKIGRKLRELISVVLEQQLPQLITDGEDLDENTT